MREHCSCGHSSWFGCSRVVDLIGLWMCKMPVKDGMLVPGVAACCTVSLCVCRWFWSPQCCILACVSLDVKRLQRITCFRQVLCSATAVNSHQGLGQCSVMGSQMARDLDVCECVFVCMCMHARETNPVWNCRPQQRFPLVGWKDLQGWAPGRPGGPCVQLTQIFRHV